MMVEYEPFAEKLELQARRETSGQADCRPGSHRSRAPKKIFQARRDSWNSALEYSLR